MLKFFSNRIKLVTFEYNLKTKNMKNLIGFTPTAPTPHHVRTKNLTGDVKEIENDIVTVDFSIIENKKEVTLTVCYPLDECKDYFVTAPIEKNGLTFHQFCMELKEIKVYLRNQEVPKWLLFWNGVNVDFILSNRVGNLPRVYLTRLN